ncbi:MAG: ribonuclease R [Bacteriovoracia bacterium]
MGRKNFDRKSRRKKSFEKRSGEKKHSKKGHPFQKDKKPSFRPKHHGPAGPRNERKNFHRVSEDKRGGGFITITGPIQKNAKGFAFLLREKEDDVFLPPDYASKLFTGDTVKVWVRPHDLEVFKLQILQRNLKQFIGTYQKPFVLLQDRTMSEKIKIDPQDVPEDVKSEDKVLTVITQYEPYPKGKILRTFGSKLAPKFDTLAVVIRSNWPQEFSKDALEVAERNSIEIQRAAAEKNYAGRRDFRDKHFVTIDGKDARDFDDAILVEKTASGYVLYVAIADVAEFVIPGEVLDKEAYERATSVYFPEWVIPMLPEALSNGACSLRPDEEKLTLTCEMHYDLSGKKKNIKVYETVIKSKRRCIYEDVQKEFDAGEEFWKIPYELFKLIRKQKIQRGALDLELPETKVVLDENSDTIGIKKLERLDAHKLIEEFMIAANESVTEIAEREGIPFVYRVHEPPEPKALEKFEKFARSVGLKPDFGDGVSPKFFAQFVKSLHGKPNLEILHYLLLRSLKQARYDFENLKHFGLASQAYTHFTSPIRRYPDLIVHRILKKYIRHKTSELRGAFIEYLGSATEHCSKQERFASDLDRQVIKIKKARFMEKFLGESFTAKITNLTDKGLYVELEKWFIDGLVPMDELGQDIFEFVEEKFLIRGKRTSRVFRLSDTLTVTVLRTDTENGFIDFTLCSSLRPDTRSHKP